MEIVGKKVSHKLFGIGTITRFRGKEQNSNKYIIVQFENKSVEFPYPTAFENHLQAVDPSFAKSVEEELEKSAQNKINEQIMVNASPIKKLQTQKHKPISYCSINTFVFKKELGYNKSKNKQGFLAFDKSGRCVGVVFMNDDERKPSYGQAEICFFDEYREDFGQWRLISINKERLSFERLSKILDQQGDYEVTIDPRKGS